MGYENYHHCHLHDYRRPQVIFKEKEEVTITVTLQAKDNSKSEGVKVVSRTETVLMSKTDTYFPPAGFYITSFQNG